MLPDWVSSAAAELALRLQGQHPKGPYTAQLRTLVPTTIPGVWSQSP